MALSPIRLVLKVELFCFYMSQGCFFVFGEYKYKLDKTERDLPRLLIYEELFYKESELSTKQLEVSFLTRIEKGGGEVITSA